MTVALFIIKQKMEAVILSEENKGIMNGPIQGRGGINQFIDYVPLLNNVPYSKFASFLKVGEIPENVSWLLFISIVKQQFGFLLPLILPVLSEENVVFLIPENSSIHTHILEGGFGLHKVGKVITIIAPVKNLARLAENLIKLTIGFKGPAIPGASHLGGCVYTAINDEYNTSMGCSASERHWPFKQIKSEAKISQLRWLSSKYLILETLKSDVKGNVFKAIYFVRPFKLSICIVKQGKLNQCFDDHGRTIHDRLKWQYHIHHILADALPIPKSIDFFEDNDASYLVMECIDGCTLLEAATVLQEGRSWMSIPLNNKLSIINLALQCIEFLKGFHDSGYIHRDLNPMNFMVNKANKVYGIDLELCCNHKESLPMPAFHLGTPGYMSKSQSALSDPRFEDDIYSLGALLIKLFTGLSPSKLSSSDPENMFKSLRYLIKNDRIAALIHLCLDQDAEKRPDIKAIRHNLEVYYSLLLMESHKTPREETIAPNPGQVSSALSLSLNEFFRFPLLKSDKWFNKSRIEDNQVANELQIYSSNDDFYSGTTGILYLLNLADQFGFDLGDHHALFYNEYKKLSAVYLDEVSNNEAGLLFGKAGFALLHAALVKNMLVEYNPVNYNLVFKLLQVPNHQLNIASGLAGQGVASLSCMQLLKFPSLKQIAAEAALKLVKFQHKDGSWNFYRTDAPNVSAKITGLFNGVSGILYFLLLNCQFNYCEQSKNAAVKGLEWLKKQRRLSNGHALWTVNSKSSNIDPWLENGFTGIAFAFFKAYEILGNPEYCEVATDALLSHPSEITSNYLGQAAGLSGLGEVYLEAFRITKEKTWYDRAGHIANQLLHAGSYNNNGGLYWLEGSDTVPTAEFMNGNSGIVHFLLRYNNPGKIGFHLFSI